MFVQHGGVICEHPQMLKTLSACQQWEETRQVMQAFLLVGQQELPLLICSRAVFIRLFARGLRLVTQALHLRPSHTPRSLQGWTLRGYLLSQRLLQLGVAPAQLSIPVLRCRQLLHALRQRLDRRLQLGCLGLLSLPAQKHYNYFLIARFPCQEAR